MRALALVTARELRAYAPAWMAVLVAALLPWLSPLLPSAGRQPASDVRLVTALVLGALLGLVIALFAGAGLLARDLGEGRMGFFLALPLRTATVWAGRLLAAVILVYATLAAIVLPAALAAGEVSLQRDLVLARPLLGVGGGAAGLLLVLVPLVLVLLAHQLATGLRSRSPWLLADLAGLAIAAGLAGRALVSLAAAWASTELLVAAIASSTLAVAALVFGGGLGLARGGVLLARVHRVQAVTIAAGLLLAGAATAAFSCWVLAVDAGDVASVQAARAAPSGSWVATVGSVRHRPSYAPWMLVDAASGRSLPLSAGIVETSSNHRFELPPPVTFAADGRSAVWLRHEVEWIDLAGAPHTMATGIGVSEPWHTALLPAGDVLAVAERQRLSVWSERGRRLLAAAELPWARAYWQELRLLAPHRVRLVRLADVAGEPSRLQVFDLDADARRLVRRVDQPVEREAPNVALSADGERLLLAHDFAGRGGITLLEATTGVTLAELAASAKEDWLTATFLPAGRVALARGHAGRIALHLFDRQGAPLHEIDLGAGRWARLGVPWSGDRLPFTTLVRSSGSEPPDWRGELRVVDLQSGAVRELGARLSPVVGAFPWSPGDDRTAPESPASRLFQTPDHALVRVDDAGRQQRVLPRPS